MTQIRKSPFTKLQMKIDGERSSSLDLARGRIVLVVALFLMAYIVIGGRLVDATIIQGALSSGQEGEQTEQNQEAADKKQRRSDIVDRNGVYLASSLKTASLYADPARMTDIQTSAKELAKIFSDLNYGELLQRLQDNKQKNRRFVWIKRNITPEEQKKILLIGDPGLAFDYDYKRIYPQGPLTAHVVGFTDVDGRGLAGVERSFNSLLKKAKEDEPLQLSLDIRLQHILRREVQKAIDDFTAIGGSGLIMDVETGELLAAVSLPDFDPHASDINVNDPRMFNRFSLGVYELGSTFKIFTTAALLDKKKVRMDKTFDAINPIRTGNHMIRDFHPEKRILTVPEVFMVSSNIGTAKMGQAIGTDQFQKFLKDLGLMERQKFELEEVGSPIIPRPWRDISTLTVSFGHGMSVTPLQMVSATASIINGGTKVKPTLIKKPETENENTYHTRVVSQETSLKMRQLMRLVVSKGTGSKADIPGYRVGGKTGTAEKNINGRYSRDKRISSFVSVFPIDKPKYAVFVMVDEPKPNKSSFGYATAGWVAAPAVGRVIAAMGPLLNIEPDRSAMDISEPLFQFLHEKPKEH
jgi:cell division protein FtsI (penicillin-binding protein 3)